MQGTESYTTKALPASLMPEKPKTILPGIIQQQIQVIQSNALNQPTLGGATIDWYLPQLPNTFLDCASAMFVLHVSAQFSMQNGYGANQYNFAHNINGCILGSFYSLFQRFTVYANSVNVTDDIWELGIVGYRILNVSMTKDAKEAMAWILGFDTDIFANGLAGYRIRGSFPMMADGDSVVLLNGAAGTGAFQGLAIGGGAGPFFFTQQFNIAIPVPGSVGINNPGMYYMGLGNTRISLITETPANFLLLPATATAIGANTALQYTQYVPTFAQVPANPATSTVAENVLVTCNVGGFQLVAWNITRCRIEANTVTVPSDILNEILTMAGAPQLISKTTNFTVSTQPLQQGTSGLQNLQVNNRKGSMRAVMFLFNNQGACTGQPAFVTANTGVEYQNFFNKYGSINPGAGPNTLLSVNNTNYPKIGLNPTQYPCETWSYILESLGLLVTDSIKPTTCMQNWLVADPSVIAYQLNSFTPATGPGTGLSGATTNFWRSGLITNGSAGGIAGSQVAPAIAGPAAAALGVPNNLCALSAWWPWCFQSYWEWFDIQCVTGGPKIPFSNDFFLYFNLEDTPRPGLISGKNTMDGSNYLNLNLVAPTSYRYNVYIIGIADAIMVHDFNTKEVFMIS